MTFGADGTGTASIDVVGTAGDADATGYAAAIRTVVANRIRGSAEYSTATVETTPGAVGYLLVVAPSVARPINDRIHNISTSIETEVPETATRVLLLYRVGTGFVRPSGSPDSKLPAADSRF